MIPFRPVLHPGAGQARTDDRLLLVAGARRFIVEGDQQIEAVDDLLQHLDGRPAEQLVGGDLSVLASRLKILGELAGARFLVEADARASEIWRVPDLREGGGASRAEVVWVGLSDTLDGRTVPRPAVAQPWLPIVVEFGEARIGPLVTAESACPACTTLRELGLSPDVQLDRALLHQTPATLPAEIQVDLSRFATNLAGLKGPLDRCWVLDLVLGRYREHTVLAHPSCPGDIHRPIAAGRPRSHGMRLSPIIDFRFGITEPPQVESARPDRGPFTAVTRFALPQPDMVRGVTQNWAGALAEDVSTAETLAVVEATERYALLVGGNRVRRAAWVDVSDSAVDPRGLPLWNAATTARDDFPFEPFDERRPYCWVEATNLTTQEPVLMLHDAVYCAPVMDHLLAESSSGAAAHRSWDLAVAHAAQEVVERDAFVVHWAHRRTPRRIKCESLPDGVVADLEEFTDSGATVTLCDLTTDVLLPVILGLARNVAGSALLAGAGCALTPAEAAAKAVRELLAGKRSRKRSPVAIEAPLEERAVLRLADHAKAYVHEAWAEKAAFLWTGGEEVALSDLPTATGTGHLDAIKKALDSAGYQLIAVDITPPDLRNHGLAVARAVIPGLQPIGFGQHWLRDGGYRLATAPVKMGFASAVELNRTPHCFP